MRNVALLFGAFVVFAEALVAQIPPAAEPLESATVAASRNDWVKKADAKKTEAQGRAGSVRVVFEGDSITEGWGGRLTQGRFAKLGVANFAIAGDRTQNVLWRLENGQLDGLKPKVVFLLIGTNNIKDDPGDIADGVEAVVTAYRKRLPEAVIVLQGIFPRAPRADDPARAKMTAVNQQIAKLADGEKVVYLDFGDKFLQPDGSLSAEVMPDYLHLSPKGYEIWAEAIGPVLAKYFPGEE